MLGRCRRQVLVCDTGMPRNRRSAALHGFLTRDGIAPQEFNARGRDELAQYGVEFRLIGVTGASRFDDHFRVSLADGRDEASKFLLLATGVVDDLPLMAGFDECYGRSIFHCPYCDGWEQRDRRLAALGPGTPGANLALALKTWSADVVLCTNGRRLSTTVRRRLERNGVGLRQSAVDRIEQADGILTAVVFSDGEVLPRDAVFFQSGQHPQSDLASSIGCSYTRRGTVDTGGLCDTNVPGVFVAGDASRDAQFVAVAAAEGLKAAVAINQALQREELAR